VGAELTAKAQVAFHFAEPAGETAGIGERRPDVVDLGVQAILDARLL
jgi:hypothetical protein